MGSADLARLVGLDLASLRQIGYIDERGADPGGDASHPRGPHGPPPADQLPVVPPNAEQPVLPVPEFGCGLSRA